MSEEKNPNPDAPKPANVQKAKVRPQVRKAQRVDDDEIRPDDKKKHSLMHKIGLTIILLLGIGMIFPYNMSSRNFLGNGGQGAAIGKLNGKDVYQNELDLARDSWTTLGALGATVLTGNGGGDTTLARLLGRQYGLDVEQFVTEHPTDGFWLLMQAAKQVVPGVSDQSTLAAYNGEFGTIADELASEPMQITKVYIRGPMGEQTQLTADHPRKEQILRALHDFLLVSYLFKAEAGLPQPSEAMVNNITARFLAEVKTTGIKFNASDYLARVAATASDAELAALLTKYADVNPNAGPSVRSPLGFGYKLQNRVKTQTLTVKLDDVRVAVRAAKLKEGSQAWDLAARRFYRDHPSLFTESTTQPANASSTQPAGTASTQPTSTTQPTFEAVRQKAIDLAIDEETLRRLDGPRQPGDAQPPVMERISQMMREDYKAWVAAGSKTDASYLAPDYLNKLATTIQAQYGVLPVIDSNDRDERDATALNADTQFKRFSHGQADPRSWMPAVQYVLTSARPFVPTTALTRMGDTVLDIGEPSDVLFAPTENGNPWSTASLSSLPLGDRMVVRITDAQTARAATADDLAKRPTLKTKVLEDWRLSQAMAQARDEATKTTDAARRAGNMSAVAGTGKPALPINVRFTDTTASDAVTGWGPDAAGQLLSAGADPFVTLDNPKEHAVYALQRESIGSVSASTIDPDLRRAGVTLQLRGLLASGAAGTLFPGVDMTPPLQSSLLDIDELKARVGYKPAGKE
ncbi:MAG: hypothetical protein QM770_17480 [Tepidisphaeraceae bacterium]